MRERERNLLIAGANVKREGKGLLHTYMLILFLKPILINPSGKKEMQPSVNVASASLFPNVTAVTRPAIPLGAGPGG